MVASPLPRGDGFNVGSLEMVVSARLPYVHPRMFRNVTYLDTTQFSLTYKVHVKGYICTLAFGRSLVHSSPRSSLE